MNIKEIIITDHCFGENIEIDQCDIKDIKKEDLQNWMFDKIKNMQDYDFNEIFKQIAWTAVMEHENVYHNKCDQCGDYNSKTILKF
jgi:hypothetical protein